ncbi:MAG: cyanophycin synthetase [Opitutae bacterium]
MIYALKNFGGVKRRQETLLEMGGIIVMEDFAHHPTALAGTLNSFRNRFPKSSIVACFEPRSNTATTNVFQRDFTNALSNADEILLGAVHRGEKISDEERLDTAAMVTELKSRGRTAHAFSANSQLLAYIRDHFSPQSGDPVLICFFSNGGFDGVPASYVSGLKPDVSC